MPTQETPPENLVIRFLCLGCALLILVATTLQVPQIVSARQPDKPAVPIDMDLSVGDHALHVHCEGNGGPLVMLAHGLGGSLEEWAIVQPLIAASTTVCAWDRAGEGRSEPDPGAPHSAEDASRDLEALLQAMHVDQPVVLVGFSVGGLLARHFATTRPRAVAGLVLVDATSPVATAMNLSGAAIEPRIDRLLFFSGLHPSANEHLDILKASEEVFMLGTPSVPTVVLSAGVKRVSAGIAGDQRAQIATRLQVDQARELDARLVVVPGCAHAMPVDCPNAVADAIEFAIDAVRRSTERQLGHPDALLVEPGRVRRIRRGKTTHQGCLTGSQ